MWVIGWVGCAVRQGALCGGCVWIARCWGLQGSHRGGSLGGRLWFFGLGGEARVAEPGAVHAGGRVRASG